MFWQYLREKNKVGKCLPNKIFLKLLPHHFTLLQVFL